jgi:hypothetical protein
MRYWGFDEDGFHAVKQTTDGGYVATGYTWSMGNGSGDMLVVKTNASGMVDWAAAVGEGSDQTGHDIIQTTDGRYVAVGESFGTIVPFHGSNPRSGSNNFYFVKLGSSGAKEWSRLAGGFNQDEARDVVEVGSGYVAGGWSESFSPGGDPDAAICQFDQAGAFVWADAYDFQEGYQEGYAIEESDDGFVVFGFTSGPVGEGGSGVGVNGLAFEVEENGEVVWGMAYGSDAGQDELYDGVATADGGYAMTGYTRIGPQISFEDRLYQLKSNEEGVTTCYEGSITMVRQDSLWEHGVAQDSAIDITVDIGSDPAGVSENDETPWDSSLCLLTAVPKLSQTDVMQVSPNPATDHVTIATPAGAVIEITDLAGRHVASRVCTSSHIILSTREMPRGVYLVKATQEGRVLGATKLVLR